MTSSSNMTVATIWNFFNTYFSMNNPTWSFIILYFLLIVLFSFFYVSITFNTDNVAESIQKRWWYIPWIRPGSETSTYLWKVSAHLNLFGGSFLALIAVLPYVVSKIRWWETIDFIISGAGLIIICSVILDVARKVNSELKMYDYSKYK
jgi:preprotein translocase subunit SecY